nr:hypothetical protein [Tanacetum cinerariifolium]
MRIKGREADNFLDLEGVMMDHHSGMLLIELCHGASDLAFWMGKELKLKKSPLKHLVFEEPELDKQELGKLEVRKPGVDKQEREENQVVKFDLTSSEDDSWRKQLADEFQNKITPSENRSRGSFSSQIRAAPPRENGKIISLIDVFETFGHFKSQELKTISYHKLYDILKQHQNEVNEIRAERLARTANPFALVAQQQPVYHPQNYPTHYTQTSSTRSQQATTRNRGKAIVNSPLPIYDQEPSMVAEDDKMSKDKEIDKLMALISLSFKKIYKPTNNNLRTSSNTSRANQDNSPRINRGTGYDNQRIVNVVGAKDNVARECQKPKRPKDAAYDKEKMLLCKQEEAGFQLNAEQADWRDDTDDEPDDQELEAHYMYMAQLQEVTPDASKVNDTHPVDNVIIDSLDMSCDREQIDQDDDDDLANERDLLASLIEKLKCEIDDSKNRNKFLKTSNKALVDKLKELDRYHDVKYASKVENDCAKAKWDLTSYKMESEKSFNEYTRKINDLNQTISEMKKELLHIKKPSPSCHNKRGSD